MNSIAAAVDDNATAAVGNEEEVTVQAPAVSSEEDTEEVNALASNRTDDGVDTAAAATAATTNNASEVPTNSTDPTAATVRAEEELDGPTTSTTNPSSSDEKRTSTTEPSSKEKGPSYLGYIDEGGSGESPTRRISQEEIQQSNTTKIITESSVQEEETQSTKKQRPSYLTYVLEEDQSGRSANLQKEEQATTEGSYGEATLSSSTAIKGSEETTTVSGESSEEEISSKKKSSPSYLTYALDEDKKSGGAANNSQSKDHQTFTTTSKSSSEEIQSEKRSRPSYLAYALDEDNKSGDNDNSQKEQVVTSSTPKTSPSYLTYALDGGDNKSGADDAQKEQATTSTPPEILPSSEAALPPADDRRGSWVFSAPLVLRGSEEALPPGAHPVPGVPRRSESAPGVLGLVRRSDTALPGGPPPADDSVSRGPDAVEAPVVRRRSEARPGAYSAEPGVSYLVRRADSNYEGSSREFNLDPDDVEGHGLVEANPVIEDAIGQAHTIATTGNQDSEGNGQKKKNLLKMAACGCVAAAVVAAVVALLVSLLNVSAASEEGPSTNMDNTEEESYNIEALLEDLPTSTVDNIFVEGTPQAEAHNWLANHPNVMNLPLWRLRQMFALATFYHAFAGPEWPEKVRTTWLDYTREECSWMDTLSIDQMYELQSEYMRSRSFDVRQCNDAGEVQTIILTQLGIKRSNPFIPPEVALLSSLTMIVLPNNKISADLATFFPLELTQMPNLGALALAGNDIRGTVPSEFGLFGEMEHLLLTNNHLSGSIPTEFGMMSNLRQLSAQNNDFVGALPSELGSLTSMTYLELSHAFFTGTIPTEIGKMTIVDRLALNMNDLSGGVPSELGLLRYLGRLHLQDNRLSGSVPSEFGQLHFLYGVELHRNALSGSLPELGKLGNASRLSHVILADNAFSGVVPERFCSLGVYEGPSFLGPSDIPRGFSFDCSDQLCGCCWCPCQGNNNSVACQTGPIGEDNNLPGKEDTSQELLNASPTGCAPLTHQDCQESALDQGLLIGGGGYDFVGNYNNKGCYYYPSNNRDYGNTAYFGVGGSDAEMSTLEPFKNGGLRLVKECD